MLGLAALLSLIGDIVYAFQEVLPLASDGLKYYPHLARSVTEFVTNLCISLGLGVSAVLLLTGRQAGRAFGLVLGGAVCVQAKAGVAFALQVWLDDAFDGAGVSLLFYAESLRVVFMLVLALVGIFGLVGRRSAEWFHERQLARG